MSETRIRVIGVLNNEVEIERSLHYRVHVPFIGDFDLHEEEKTALFLILNRDFPDFLKRIDEKVGQLGSEMLQQGYSANELFADVTFEVLPSVSPDNLGVFYVSIAVKVCPKQFPDFCRVDRITLGEREYISRSFDAPRNKAGKHLRDTLAYYVALSLAHQLKELEFRYEECSNIIDKVSDSCPELLEQLEGDGE